MYSNSTGEICVMLYPSTSRKNSIKYDGKVLSQLLVDSLKKKKIKSLLQYVLNVKNTII